MCLNLACITLHDTTRYFLVSRRRDLSKAIVYKAHTRHDFVRILCADSNSNQNSSSIHPGLVRRPSTPRE